MTMSICIAPSYGCGACHSETFAKPTVSESVVPQFKAYPKTRRLTDVYAFISEKIDGTNGVLFVDGSRVVAGSRSKWLVDDGSKSWDNHGFGAWVKENEVILSQLPDGFHYGEWYGRGINRNYGLKDRRFMLFNRMRYLELLELMPSLYKVLELETILSQINIMDVQAQLAIHKRELMHESGSRHVRGFKRPEGVMVRIPAADKVFKVVWDKD